MKTILLTVLILMAFAGYSQLTSVNLQASGLTCAMCSRSVQKSLEKVPFVKEVKTDLKTQEYLISFKDGMDVNFDALRKSVEDAGFSVARFQATGNFQNLQVNKDSLLRLRNQSFYFLNIESINLDGQQIFTIVEKGFLTPKALKKYCSDRT